MSFGLRVARGDGSDLVSQTILGGRLWAGEINRAAEPAGTQSTFTFPLVPGGSNLVLYQTGRSSHTWTTGTNGSGQATVTLTALTPRPISPPPTSLQVFTRATTEPDFGILVVNDAGERTVSGVMPAAEFLGRFTMGAATNVFNTGLGGYFSHTHSAVVSVPAASGRRCVVLWDLPVTSADAWWTSDESYIPQGNTGSLLLRGHMLAPSGTSYTIPAAYVFAISGIQPSTDPFGIRVFDGSGNVMFDGGRNHMVVAGISSISYPLALTTGTSSFTVGGFSGINPAVFVPAYLEEEWQEIPGQVRSNIWRDYGCVRRSAATTLQTKRLRRETFTEDAQFNNNYVFGASVNLPMVFVNASMYGG